MLRLVGVSLLVITFAPSGGCIRSEPRKSMTQLRVFTSNSGIRFVRIPGGVFTMGVGDSYGPKRKVRVDPFWISECEITYQDLRVVRPNLQVQNKLLPVTGVRFKELAEILTDLCISDGARYVLPTDAQWERAARGGVEEMEYPWSKEDRDDKRANLGSEGLLPVKQYPPNQFGLYDVIGNATEIVSDGYYAPQKSSRILVNPIHPANGREFVGRGGSYLLSYSPLSYRTPILDAPDFPWGDIGFRLVLADSKDIQEASRVETLPSPGHSGI